MFSPRVFSVSGSGSVCLLLGCLLALACAQPYLVPRTCGRHETYLSCGPNCDTECATLGQPCLINYIRCPDGCYCNKGYARDASGSCIRISRCKKQATSSGPYSN
ncbi:hypothetical protein KR222_002312 [Zaprionus bogoriensis]|nr:hypothetical protein KR222_002312 [Zaprionus bogoriensis]